MAIFAWAGGFGGGPPKTVAEQWIEAISQYGIEPAYPPQEDILVGDIFVVIAEDQKQQPLDLVRSSLRIWHADLTTEINEAYRTTYQFPGTTDRPGDANKLWIQTPSQGSIFDAPEKRSTLPVMILPDFTVSTQRSAQADVGGLGALAARLGLAAQSGGAVTMKVESGETYGVPAIPAEDALLSFCKGGDTKSECTDATMRAQLSIVYGSKIYEPFRPWRNAPPQCRFSLELALVNRVYLTRSIETIVEQDAAVSAEIAAGEAPQNATPTADRTPAASTPAGSANKTTRPGALMTVRQSDRSHIATTQTLERPIVIGFRTVRWRPSSEEPSSCAAQ